MFVNFFFIQAACFIISSNAITSPDNIITASDGIQGVTFPAKPNDLIKEIANWTTTKISSYTNVNGTYKVQNINKIFYQVTGGMNYFLTIQ
jgi:hypothetical protein